MESDSSTADSTRGYRSGFSRRSRSGQRSGRSNQGREVVTDPLPALEAELYATVEAVQLKLDILIGLLDLKIQYTLNTSAMYYWVDCRDRAVRIKNQINKLKEMVNP